MTLRVADCHAVHDALLSRGAVFLTPPYNWGKRSAASCETPMATWWRSASQQAPDSGRWALLLFSRTGEHRQRTSAFSDGDGRTGQGFRRSCLDRCCLLSDVSRHADANRHESSTRRITRYLTVQSAILQDASNQLEDK
jgi:hypothetical protein